MFSGINYLYTSLMAWQKAVFFSFISYSVILFGIIVFITFILKDFNILLVFSIVFIYMICLTIIIFVATRIFKKRLIER